MLNRCANSVRFALDTSSRCPSETANFACSDARLPEEVTGRRWCAPGDRRHRRHRPAPPTRRRRSSRHWPARSRRRGRRGRRDAPLLEQGLVGPPDGHRAGRRAGPHQARAGGVPTTGSDGLDRQGDRRPALLRLGRPCDEQAVDRRRVGGRRHGVPDRLRRRPPAQAIDQRAQRRCRQLPRHAGDGGGQARATAWHRRRTRRSAP